MVRKEQKDRKDTRKESSSVAFLGQKRQKDTRKESSSVAFLGQKRQKDTRKVMSTIHKNARLDASNGEICMWI
jgi:hypothetical protein